MNGEFEEDVGMLIIGLVALLIFALITALVIFVATGGA